MAQQVTQNGAGASISNAHNQPQNQQLATLSRTAPLHSHHSPPLAWQQRVKNWFSAYFSAFAAVGVVIQFIASVVTVALYFAPQRFFFLSDTIWYAPINGAILSYVIVWPLAALAFRHIATAKGGNARSYGLLRARYHQLIARLGPEEYDPFPKDEKERLDLAKLTDPQPYQLVALREAYRCMESVRDMLLEHSTGLMWVMGFGYITAWGMLHRAEESLIELEPLPLVIRGAMHDKWAIQHSDMGNREELLESIIQAVADADESALVQFKEHQPGVRNKDVARLQYELRDTKKQIGQITQTLDDHNIHIPTPAPNTAQKPPIEDAIKSEARGRFALHEVRRTLNQYRDSKWEGLVRARNQLWSTAALTALITHILVCVAILVGSSNQNIIAATAFYITGAMAGLFIRFYRESTINSAVDDYGLSTVRLVVTPLLSGLAAIGGVLIISLLYGASLDASSATIQAVPSLSKIFLLDNPLRLLAAAIFGVAPNLIIKSLQNQTEKYTADLQSSGTITGVSSKRPAN